jgi:hypothetical protein
MIEKEFSIKRSFLDGKMRKLIFNENFLKFENRDLREDPFTTFPKDEIVEYRFGIRWIRFELTYGREYQLYIRNKKNETIKVSFKSYLGRKKKILHHQFNEILDALWDFYFADLINSFLMKHENGESFSIGGVDFTETAVTINVSGLFSLKKTVIRWENVRTRNYQSYFCIYSNENPTDINRGYDYFEDWNTSVLYSVLRTILRDKGIEKYS